MTSKSCIFNLKMSLLCEFVWFQETIVFDFCLSQKQRTKSYKGGYGGSKIKKIFRTSFVCGPILKLFFPVSVVKKQRRLRNHYNFMAA